MKRIIAITLACFIALSSSVVSSQAVAAEDKDLADVAIDNKGKVVGLIVGCVVAFPVGCVIGADAGVAYDEVVEPMIVGEGGR